MLTDPVKVCVFAVELPNMLEPELNSMEELTVFTIKVCAVKVPNINALEDVMLPLTLKLPLIDALVFTLNP
jgi:hypothetical protein